MTSTHLLVFAAGVAYDGAHLIWLSLAAKGRPWLSSFASMTVGTISIYGVSSVVHGPDAWPWLIAGYGVGNWIVVRWGKGPGRGSEPSGISPAVNPNQTCPCGVVSASHN